MNGQMMNYKKSITNTVRPIMPSELPNVKIDYAGLLSYAKSKGLKVVQLSENEKSKFITRL